MSCCGTGDPESAQDPAVSAAADPAARSGASDVDVVAVEAELAARRVPYCLATVVWRRAPTSARTGAKVLVTADGELRGWLGGACAEPAVLRVALQALHDGRPRLLCLGDEAEFPEAGPGREVQPVGCASEGALEVFIEPHLPRPQVVTLGEAPLVGALADMAGTLDFEVHRLRISEEAEDLAGEIRDALAAAGVGSASFVVVATMGRFDEAAVSAALATGAPYVALVASRRRADAASEHLRGIGTSDTDLERLRAPAGLDLGPVGHREIAVAVLAEIVQLRAAGMGRGAVEEKGEQTARAAGVTAEPAEAVDPVCGMTVATRPARHTAEHQGRTYHFCCAGCRERFAAAPETFLEASA